MNTLVILRPLPARNGRLIPEAQLLLGHIVGQVRRQRQLTRVAIAAGFNASASLTARVLQELLADCTVEKISSGLLEAINLGPSGCAALRRLVREKDQWNVDVIVILGEEASRTFANDLMATEWGVSNPNLPALLLGEAFLLNLRSKTVAAHIRRSGSSTVL
ncbi:hypothetical protein HY523_02085 [Candidatus Berkelbacteria bacterium]|nr:hypothetical protein [Candidatus Berkelbacteria bacterium]